MINGTIYVGLDVHLRQITPAVIEADGAERVLGQIPNQPKAIRRLMDRLSPDRSRLQVVYEAGPTGFVIARQLEGLGIACTVAAPAQLAQRPGDRVKTDRKDARKLARALRNDEVSAVAVPSPELEALRSLSRLREEAMHERHRCRQQLLKLLHRLGMTEPAGMRRWGTRYDAWLDALALAEPVDQLVLTETLAELRHRGERLDRITAQLLAAAADGPEAELITRLQALHGIGPLTAIGLVAELGDLRRFAHPRKLMAFAGLVPSEQSTGEAVRRGGITRTGNAHVRWLVTEAAWHYARPSTRPLASPVAERARTRLCQRYRDLRARHKHPNVAVVAVAREVLGFIWEVAVTA
jgi:transposase